MTQWPHIGVHKYVLGLIISMYDHDYSLNLALSFLLFWIVLYLFHFSYVTWTSLQAWKTELRLPRWKIKGFVKQLKPSVGIVFKPRKYAADTKTQTNCVCNFFWNKCIFFAFWFILKVFKCLCPNDNWRLVIWCSADQSLYSEPERGIISWIDIVRFIYKSVRLISSLW